MRESKIDRGLGSKTGVHRTETKADEAHQMDDMPGHSNAASARRPSSSLPSASAESTTNSPVIKIEDDSDDEDVVVDAPSFKGDPNPDLFWIKEWATLDLKSAIASQVDFFKTCPRFNGSRTDYVYFFLAIQRTIRKAEASVDAVKDDDDVTAAANLRSLQIYFEDFANTCRSLLMHDLDRLRGWHYTRSQTVPDMDETLQGHSDFLDLISHMASLLGLEKEWWVSWTSIRAAKNLLLLAKEQGSFADAFSSVRVPEPEMSSLQMRGPLSPELLRMDYDFTDAIWSQWIEGCISYFTYWTADPSSKIPAEDFIRHISHYQLAMELFLRDQSISEERHYTLLNLAEKYMSQYRNYAAVQLETKYGNLKEDIKSAGIYHTEARFWQLADDIAILMNEAPQIITQEAWDGAVPAILPRHKLLAAQRATKVLYKEFQTKRYPEDEVSYLWWLTWRNIKHILPYLTSPPTVDAIQTRPERLPVTIEARDLALPFVERNLSRLLAIVRKDNDILYHKEIESLMADYCAHIDRFARGKGEGQERVYEQFARLSRTKRVPYPFLVALEEDLLKQEAPPANTAQMVAHRVVMRLNHIMEGPKEFKRWEITQSGELRTYSATLTWLKEQEELAKQGGFRLDDDLDPNHSSYGPSEAPGAGAGAGAGGGGDDGNGGDKRNFLSGDSGESSSSDEEVEEQSPGGTKRLVKQKRRKTGTAEVNRKPLTKASLEQLEQMVRLASRPDSDFTRERPGPEADGADENKANDDGVISGLHPVPSDSLDYHRRRMSLLRVEQRSAVPNAQYPLPETAAAERAAALQIERELADPGISTDGPRAEEVQSYINPAFRLPLTEDDHISRGEEQEAEPHLIRRALRSVRSALGSPLLSASPKYRPTRARPSIPESNAQRARREREAREVTPPVLKRQPDRYSITKSPPRDSRPRHAAHNVPSTNDLAGDASGVGQDLPWSGRYQGNRAAAADGASHRTAQENQTRSGNSPAQDSNQENRSQAKIVNRENQGPVDSPDHVRRGENDWNTPSPPRQYDNQIIEGSPIRTPSTPTHVRGSRYKASGNTNFHAQPPDDGRAEHNKENLDARPFQPPLEVGTDSQLRALNRWIGVEIASNNRDMRAAHLLYRELHEQQSSNTIHYLYEMLRAHVEMATYNDYVFERDVTFGEEAHARVRRGAPGTVPAPSTPPAQIYPHSECWWYDPLEGTRHGIRRPGVAWVDAPHEEEAGDEDGRHRQLRPDPAARGDRDSRRLPVAPSLIRDKHGLPIPWEVLDDRQPLGRHNATSPRFSSGGERTWSWQPNANTGLPEREFNIYSNADVRPRRALRALGEPLLIQNPLIPGQLTTNPTFNPDILQLISAAGSGDDSQINVRVPPGWRVNIGPTDVEAGDTAPSRPGGRSSASSSRPGEQGVTITSPGFTIHEDAPSGTSLRDWSDAPPTLGLVDSPPQQRRQQQQRCEDVVEETQQLSFDVPNPSPDSPRHHTNKRSPRSGHSGSGGSSGKPDPSKINSKSGLKSTNNNNNNVISSSTDSSAHTIIPGEARLEPEIPPPPRSPDDPSESPPWYTQWHTSTVHRLRAELQRRGIPLSGLKLKRQMMDRLREDDGEEYENVEEDDQDVVAVIDDSQESVDDGDDGDDGERMGAMGKRPTVGRKRKNPFIRTAVPPPSTTTRAAEEGVGRKGGVVGRPRKRRAML